MASQTSASKAYEEITKSGSTVFSCCYCEMQCSNRYNIIRHIKTKHGVSCITKTDMKYKKYHLVSELTLPRNTASQKRKANDETDSVDLIGEALVVPTSVPDHVDDAVNSTSDVTAVPTLDSVINSKIDSDEPENILSSTTSLSSLHSSSSSSEEEDIPTMTEKESFNVAAMSFIARHNLSHAASSDMFQLINAIHPECKMDEKILNSISPNISYYHYCQHCEKVFPTDLDIWECDTRGCPGLRYLGGRDSQGKSSRKPARYFVLGDIRQQLIDILQRGNMLELILRRKADALNYQSSDICDIMHGDEYRKMMENDFLSSPYAISGQLNTDGVLLRKSSKVNIWPILIAINELPASKRYKTENIILGGVWQGKSSPPFFSYLSEFSHKSNELESGFDVLKNDGTSISMEFSIVLGTFDLPAKAKVLNMTQFNGSYGCSTCEEHGERQGQGRGSVQTYPYREDYVQRDAKDILFRKAPLASNDHRIKGIKGYAGLSALKKLNIVTGIVPDYMHGILLGAVKGLLDMWMSSKNHKKDFYIGRSIARVSKRMENLKPPNEVERLPKDLATNHQHFKASEYQTILLYYGLPCFVDILGDKYMNHFLLLSEAVYLFLQDRITASDLRRGRMLCDKFYQMFSALYGDNNLGLNIHNIGAHLADFVFMWGGLHEWSNFGYEDQNGYLVKSAHGTGSVTSQLFRNKAARTAVHSQDVDKLSSEPIKQFVGKMGIRGQRLKSKPFNSMCSLLGPIKNVSDERRRELADEFQIGDISIIQSVKRIVMNMGVVVCSKMYTRSKLRVNYFVLFDDGDLMVGSVTEFFIIDGEIFALADIHDLDLSFGARFEGGKHLHKIKDDHVRRMINVKYLKEKLFFVGAKNLKLISKMPNLYGRHVAL